MAATPRPLAEAARGMDERLGGAGFLKKALKKVFPDHWTFMLGEIALYSFVIILASGVFLTFFYKPGMSDVVYRGSYVPLRGLRLSEAYESSLRISFDVRGGLLIRQIHHWATLTFLAAIVAHMLRNFFTGAFRKPRELNWVIGVVLFILVMLNGLFGYSLPDDLLSGTGIRILEGVLLAIPIVGSYLSMWVFGGVFPGDEIIPRLFTIHVLLIPGILLALIPLHAVVLTWHQTHTQYPGEGRSEHVVRGKPFFPVFILKTLAFQLWVFAGIALMATFFQINPIWLFGPYNPGSISAGSQPDWYMGWLEGSLRLMPAWEINAFGYPIAMSVLIPALVVPGLIFTALAVYPFLEQWATGDHQIHHLLDRPRDAPVRMGFGVAGCTFYGLLWLAGGNDLIAKTFDIPLFGTTWFFRVAVIVGPFIGFEVARRIALGLQRGDRTMLVHGVETGELMRMPSGEYVERERPALTEEEAVLRSRRLPQALPGLGPDGRGVEPKDARHPIARARHRLNRLYAEDVVPLPNGESERPLPDGERRPAVERDEPSSAEPKPPAEPKPR